jgi:hypothetical protein
VLREFRRRSATGRSDRAARRLWRRRTTPRLRGPSMKARTALTLVSEMPPPDRREAF